MLNMTMSCECCDRTLPPDSEDAVICSFECTFCRACATGRLDNICPNCSGDLVRRPTRAANYLERYPPSSERKPKAAICLEATVAG